mgnify:CR=1 FL=1|jgi:methionyl-tRNA formyltransferase
MKITVFTSNQPRHIKLIEKLSKISNELYVITEVTTVFPGVKSDFYSNSEIMKEYFLKVREAERLVFGNVQFFPKNCRLMILKSGDLNLIDSEIVKEAMSSDIFIVFGSSYIKGDLCKELVRKKAINIHMGVSPYYRGSSCNFWAIYDKNPEMVGATIHFLSEGLDSGDILFNVFPKSEKIDSFILGMKSVSAAQDALIEKIVSGEILKMTPIKPNKQLEIRCGKYVDFTDEVAMNYLNNKLTNEEIYNSLNNRDLNKFTNSVIK